MGLLGLVVRALGVALLTATILLPIVDHHAASRLPEAVVKPLSLQDVLTHHHSHAASAAPMRAELPLLSSVLPSTTFWAEGGAAPAAALEHVGVFAELTRLGFAPSVELALPPSFERAPPVPPPLRSA